MTSTARYKVISTLFIMLGAFSLPPTHFASAKEKTLTTGKGATSKNQLPSKSKKLTNIRWDSRIEQPSLTSAAFTEIMAHALESAVPHLKVRIKGDLE